MKNEELMRLLARRQKRNRKLLTAGRFLIGILFFAIWELCARFGIINDFIFSSPSRVIRTIQNFAANNTLWLHVSVTLKETALSFFMTMIISLFAALYSLIHKSTCNKRFARTTWTHQYDVVGLVKPVEFSEFLHFLPVNAR